MIASDGTGQHVASVPGEDGKSTGHPRLQDEAQPLLMMWPEAWRR